MKVNRIADAAIVAALLMANIPGLADEWTPDDLLLPTAVRETAQLPAEDMDQNLPAL